MGSMERNSLFTLTIIPDSGTDTKSSHINFNLILAAFTILVVVFFSCLFFIAGYHIKAYQEKGHLHAVLKMKKYITTINKSDNILGSLSEKIKKIQCIDAAFRLYTNLPVPDATMYRAGIGGHELVNGSLFEGLNEDLLVKSKDLAVKLRTLNTQVRVLRNSLHKVRSDIQEQIDLINNTPSILPTFSTNITSPFGMRRNPVNGQFHFHDAVDFSGRLGDIVYATADGTVITAAYHDIRGLFVEIRHKYGFETLYAHLNRIHVTLGQKVKKGDVIGIMGGTGRTTGINLHYGIALYGRKVNPGDYF